MEDPDLAWPAWKFGMKREDLAGTLNDRYNTFSWNIQDQEAFHHDVYEISTGAGSAEEFHRLMATRKLQRLRELNDSLESAAVEIVANPDLIGNDKWDYALQVFRTRSLDSLIRFFASHLPDDYHHQQAPHHHYPHPHHHHPRDMCSPASSTYSSFDDGTSVNSTASTAPSVHDGDSPSFFDEHDNVHLTDEPLLLKKEQPRRPGSPAGSVSSNERESRAGSLYDDSASRDTTRLSVSCGGPSFYSGSGGGDDGDDEGEDEDEERLVESRGLNTPITSPPQNREEHHRQETEGGCMRSRMEKRVALHPQPGHRSGGAGAAEQDKKPVACNDRYDDNDDIEEMPVDHALEADDTMDSDAQTPRQSFSYYTTATTTSSSSPSPSTSIPATTSATAFRQTAVPPSYLDQKVMSTERRRHPSPARGNQHRRPHRSHREGSPLDGIRRGAQGPLNRVQKQCVKKVQ